jgi:hypothetical protein
MANGMKHRSRDDEPVESRNCDVFHIFPSFAFSDDLSFSLYSERAGIRYNAAHLARSGLIWSSALQAQDSYIGKPVILQSAGRDSLFAIHG